MSRSSQQQPLLSSHDDHADLSALEASNNNNNGTSSKKQYVVYGYRWVVLCLFVLSGVANAMVLLSWAPITDKAQTYWDDINITAVNALSVIFQITYVPGTLLALRYSERLSLRDLLLRGGLLTTGGCVLRFVGALVRESPSLSDTHSAALSYTLILIGTLGVGLSQPFYLNMPAKIAATWFGVSERDIATTLCSLANPLGSAIGSLLPAMFVSSEELSEIKTGVRWLLLIHMIIALVALALSVLFLKAQPPTPASASAEQMLAKSNNNNSEGSAFKSSMFREISRLLGNREYLKLLFSFTIVLGSLNAIATLLNQLPGGFSNSEVGLTGAVLIMSGFLGAFVTGFVLDFSKAYTAVLKSTYVLTLLSWMFFLSNCRENNFALYIASAALLGASTLPTIPSTIVTAVECSYPVPEDASVGLLYMCANVTAIAMTFIGQALLTADSLGPAPLYPYGLWAIGFMALAALPVLFFKGEYLRMEQDQ